MNHKFWNWQEVSKYEVNSKEFGPHVVEATNVIQAEILAKRFWNAPTTILSCRRVDRDEKEIINF